MPYQHSTTATMFTLQTTHVRAVQHALLVLFLLTGFAFGVLAADKHDDYTIKVFTVASAPTDGYQRFNRSARINGIDVETLGMGSAWQGGDMLSTGGCYKLNLLKAALRGHEHDDDLLVLFTDGYDVVYIQSLDVIVAKFRASGAGVLFGAEHFLWPDRSVEHRYPKVTVGARFLNSGMFIGTAAKVCALLNQREIENTDDDQLFFTRAFLDEDVRTELNLKLDHLSEVFQNLNGAIAEATLKFDENGAATLINIAHTTQPAVVHGNGPSKIYLNSYGNYIAGAFVNGVCAQCDEQRIQLPAKATDLPTVTVAVFVETATPFFEEFLDLLDALDYPKARIDLFVHNVEELHHDAVQEFVAMRGDDYASVKQIRADDNVAEAAARQFAVSHAIKKQSDYLFVIDSDARLDNAQTLRELLKQNRTFIAPLLKRDKEVWSNFWGALSENGYYARSHDYMSIVEETIRGIWNVPFVSACYLVRKSALTSMHFDDTVLEPDMALCKALRKHDIFMHVSNEIEYGHLSNAEGFEAQRTRPDFYTMLSNPRDWTRRYIHPEYEALLRPHAVHKQPCPDVYWFPVVTERFCADLIAIMEAFGKWSDGSSSDERLKGGYEAVPTRDIHMNQVGLEDMWLSFLKIVVRPLQEAVFTGYYHNPPKSLMNFVVRYKPTEQPFLKPHHDSSTYTINIALNRAGIDYEGGGCRFLRYNCSVTDTKIGHMLMHPGRLTHLHEGLYTTNGTRYIMISFIDP